MSLAEGLIAELDRRVKVLEAALRKAIGYTKQREGCADETCGVCRRQRAEVAELVAVLEGSES